jgi:UDP-glucose 4-epimerase
MNDRASCECTSNVGVGRPVFRKLPQKCARLCFLNRDLVNSIDSINGTRFDVVFHLAANPEVRVSSINLEIHFKQNIITTFNLLEYIRKNHINTKFVFASTSAVYGEPTEIPRARQLNSNH